MALEVESIAARLQAIRPLKRRRRCANVLIHSMQRIAANHAVSQQPLPPPVESRINHPDDHPDDGDDADEYPSEEELARLEAELGDGVVDDGIEEEVESFADANAALETRLSYPECVTIATAVVEFYEYLVEQRSSTEALLHLIETLEDPEVGDDAVDFDQLQGDQSPM